jgi:hypothetical protein
MLIRFSDWMHKTAKSHARLVSTRQCKRIKQPHSATDMKKNYTHLELHQEFQKLVWNKMLHKRIKIALGKFKTASAEDVWTPALVSAFNYLAQDRLRVALCSYYLNDLSRLLSAVGNAQAPQDFADVSDEFFAKLVFTTIDEERWKANESNFEQVKQCVQIVRRYEQAPQAGLKLEETFALLDGLVFTLLFHPTFFDESRRENMVALMADQVAEDVLGEWPEN